MNLYCDNRRVSRLGHRNNSFTIHDRNLWSSKTPVHGWLINCMDLGREAYESMRCARPVIASQNVLTGSHLFLKLCFLKFPFLAWITLLCFMSWSQSKITAHLLSLTRNFILRTMLLLSLQARFCELYQYTFFIYVYLLWVHRQC